LNSAAENKELVQKFNEACIKKDNVFLSQLLADNIKWNIVGMPGTYGKNNFLETMKIMESAAGGHSKISIRNIIAEGEYVVAESSDSSGTISYCNIYHILNDKIVELTTYVVDVTVS
jgi:hypothetical protein